MTVNAFKNGFSELSRRDPLDLLLELWGYLAPDEDDFSVSHAQERELNRRWAAYEADPDSAVPWDELREQLSRRFK